MPDTHRIVLCGQSIFLHTIEAASAKDPVVEALRLPPSMPSIVERITAWQPDIVLIERNAKHSELALALLSRGRRWWKWRQRPTGARF